MSLLPKTNKKNELTRKIIVMAEAVEAVAKFESSDYDLLTDDAISEIRCSELFMRDVINKLNEKNRKYILDKQAQK